MAQRDAALLEPTEGREEAGGCGGGGKGGGVEQASAGCTDSEGPGGGVPTCAGRCLEQVCLYSLFLFLCFSLFLWLNLRGELFFLPFSKRWNFKGKF
jgi:hypothetical protein